MTTTQQTPKSALIACGRLGCDLCQGLSAAASASYRWLEIDADADNHLTCRTADACAESIERDGSGLAVAARIEQKLLGNGQAVAHWLAGSPVAVIIADLADAASTGAMLAVQHVADQLCIPTLAVVVLPTTQDAAHPQSMAQQTLDALLLAGRQVLKIDLADLQNLTPSSESNQSVLPSEILERTLRHAAGRCDQAVKERGFIRPYRGSSVLPGTACMSVIAWGVASGPGRAAQAAQNALDHPLFQEVLRDPGVVTEFGVTLRAAGDPLRLTEMLSALELIRGRFAEDVPVQLDFEIEANGVPHDHVEASLWAVRSA